MSKKTVSSAWFEELQTGNLDIVFDWLGPLRSSVERIAEFGCWSSEPFGLMWVLDATAVMVIEKESEHLTKPRLDLEVLEKKLPASLQGRSVSFIKADMSKTIKELPSGYFDLAFCKDVLYQIHEDLGDRGVQDAINEMSRVVRTGGWIITVESWIGAAVQEIPCTLLGRKFPAPVGEPKDIGPMFESGGLARVELGGAPEWSYCYQKQRG
jgi:SAM-dependent methyltransferase